MGSFLILYILILIVSAINASKIGIILVSDLKRQIAFKKMTENMQCYARIHNYTFINTDIDSACLHINGFFFQKHCTVRKALTKQKTLRYLLVVDGDSFVFDATKKIESFIIFGKHLIFSIRFHNNEIMAGTYIVKRSSYSLLFLEEWMNMNSVDKEKRDYVGMNEDNGALHWLLLKRLGDPDAQTNCRPHMLAGQRPFDLKIYDAFISCAHFELNKTNCINHHWNKIFIYSRWNTFFIDGWLTDYTYSTRYFMHHGLKDVRERLPPSCGELSSFEKDVFYMEPMSYELLLNRVVLKQQRQRLTGWDDNSCVQTDQMLIFIK